MKIQIEQGYRNEEVLHDTFTRDFIFVLVAVFVFIIFDGIWKVLSFLFIIFIFIYSSLNITISKAFNTVSFETFCGLKKEKLNLSDVLQIKIEADNSGLGGGDDLYFIMRDGDIKISDSSLTSDESKNLGIRIAKTIGVECAYIEDRKTTLLYQPIFESNPKQEPESKSFSKDLPDQTLRLEQGWEG